MDQSTILTKDQCVKVLEKYTGRKNVSVNKYSINPLQSELDGMMAEQYFLNIQYQDGDAEKTVQLFFKILCQTNPVMFEISRSIYAYEKESFYYETIMPLLKSKGLLCDYAPTGYFSEPFVIVLEDLSKRSLKGTPKNKPLDLQHCKKCLEILAKFHAEPILYELIKSKELGKNYKLKDEFSDVLEDRVFSKEENSGTKFMKCSIKGLFSLIDLIPENGISTSDFKNALQAVLEKVLSPDEDDVEFRSTLLHGDVWSNNFLFRYEDSEIVECVLIDFQTLSYGPPAMDILQFLFTNTRKKFRDQHLDELLNYYYRSFGALLTEHGFQLDEVLSESEFQLSCEALALPAKILSIADRGLTFLSDQDHLEAAKSEEAFAKYIFEDRGKYILNGFMSNREYRELMIEDVTQLRDMIFAK